LSAALPRRSAPGSRRHHRDAALPRARAARAVLARRLTPLRFTLGERTFEATLFDGRLASQVDLIVVDVPGLFDRAGVYGERGEDYPDNALRFAVLSRAAAELVRQRAATGAHRHRALQRLADRARPVVPAGPRRGDAGARGDEDGAHHPQRASSGVFPKDALPALGLGWEHFHVDGVEFYGGINLLKLGVVSADAVTT